MLDNFKGMSWPILAAVLLCGFSNVYSATKGQRVKSSPDIPVTQFTCVGRPPGYYADVETGCQVYHMCTEGGNQFSYRCPNTTLFQQRMLICAHWYQVNCSRSEQHYANNLLIGQRDKPFVNDDSVLTKDKQLKTLQNPDTLQNLGQAGREGSARQGKAQTTNGNVQANRVFQNNLKRDQESSVGFAGNSKSVSTSPPTNFQTANRRAQEDLSSLPLAGSVIPGGLKSVQFSRTTSQGTAFNPAFRPSTSFQPSSTSQIQFVSNPSFPNQKVTQAVSFVSPTSTSNPVNNFNIFSTTKSPFTFSAKFATDNQNKFQPSEFKKQPLSENNFKPELSTDKPSFEFIPPPGEKNSVDLAVASQENAVSSRTSTTPEPDDTDAEIGGGLPEIETTIKAIIEQPKNRSLPEDKFNTFIKRFNPFEEPPQQTTESEIKTEEPDEKEYHTFINRFIPDQTLSSSHTNLGEPIEEHVFINRFVLTPEELAREKDRVQVEKLHNLLPPDDQVTVSFPKFDLIPPLDDSADSESNKIELHLQDPRRTLFIPSSEDNSFSKADAAPIVVTIPLHSQDKSPPMWFRTEDSTDPCARCHPSFLVNKETCMPCVIIR